MPEPKRPKSDGRCIHCRTLMVKKTKDHEQQLQIPLPAAELIEVVKKIGRGCEYWLNNGRIVEPPFEIEVFFVREGDVPDVLRIFANFGPIYRGPGFQVCRTVTPDDPLTALYQMVIWGTLTAYVSIMTPQ